MILDNTTQSPLCLRHVRISRGLSIRALAELSGIHRNVISDVERRIRNPTFSEISAIAEALQVSPPDTLLREVTVKLSDAGDGSENAVNAIEVNDVR